METFQDFKGVELFRVGTWNGNTFKRKDLDEMVSAFNALKDKLKIPLKLGHSKDQKLAGDMPAVGWIENVARKGDVLVADLMKVPDVVSKLINEGAYRQRSIELLKNTEYEGNKYPWLLSGVALLGGVLPAVTGLKDIVSLYERDDFESEERIEFESEEEEDFDVVLQDIYDRLETAIKHRRGAPHIRELEKALKDAIKGTARKVVKNEVDREKITKLLGLEKDATDEVIEAKLKEFEKKEDNKEEDNKELSEAETRILELEKRVAVNEAEKVVDGAIKDGKLLPKQREHAIKMALRDGPGFQEFLKTQPENLVEFGERGQSTSTENNFSKYEPTPIEVDIAKQMGVYNEEWRFNLMRTKAGEDGVEIPSDFGKVKEGAK